jgi:2-methylcitrate dehydratase PrpD
VNIARALCTDDLVGNATILGRRKKGSAHAAAFVNATAAHALDFDDNCYAGFVHGSAVVVPAALAMSEQADANVDRLLTALVAGAECEYAMGEASMNVLYERGWWTTGVLGTIGASVAAGYLLGLSVDQMVYALGFALASAGGLKACFGSDAKALLAGRTSEAGVVYAELAALGATGPSDPVDGYVRLFNENKFNFSALESLGDRWYLLDPGIDVKRIPVCLSSHAAIDALTELVAEHQILIEDIDAIVCDVPPIVRSNLVYDHPSSAREAQFSMPFAIATTLQFGEIRLKHLQSGVWEDDNLAALMCRVSMTTGKQWENDVMRRNAPEGAIVRLYLHDGTIFERLCAKAHGSAADPLSRQALAEKFLSCTAPVLGRQEAESLLKILSTADETTPVRTLLRLEV